MQLEQLGTDRPLAASLWRHSHADAGLVALSLLHGVLLVALAAAGRAVPGPLAIALVAVALWWGSNTVAHHFIHAPFFRPALLNRVYSLYLSLVLGVPQTLWRERHLAHHARVSWRAVTSSALAIETLAVLTLWLGLALLATDFFLTVYLPGFAIGLVLCRIQGYFEHAPATASHYGALYNRLFFNDGYHVEHHERPDCHWTCLPARRRAANGSAFPPVLRWLEQLNLTGLERLALDIRPLRRYVLAAHGRAIGALLANRGPVGQVTIVGGALYPRSVLVIRALYPAARIRVIDASAAHIATARRYLARSGLAHDVEFVHASFVPGGFDPAVDLLVLPLSLTGGRDTCYARPPARLVLIHDWLWHRRGIGSRVVSPWLLKRVNLVAVR